ncbi:MAG: tetratricopeptide repeat protein, partial [Rugosibacter sp.]
MSMINQMLKDLDKRQAAAGEGQALSGVLLSSPGGKNPIRPQFLILLLAAVVFTAGAVAWSRWRQPVAATPAPVVAVAATNTPVAGPAAVSPAPTFSASAEAAPPVQPEIAAAPGKAVEKPAQAPVVVARASADPVTRAPAPQVAAAKAGDAAHEVQAETRPVASHPAAFKVVSPQQRSENLYRQAVSWIQQGHGAEAQDALRQAVGINPANHDARLLLAGLLVDANRSAEASALLRAGLSIAPGHSGFSMALARLQLGSGAKEEALATLEQGLPMAGDDPDYHAFLAALLQKQGRHEEATQHYITALRSNPSMPIWLIGVGISLRATNKMADAAEAFQRAMDTGELSPEVAKFADQQLKQVRQ